MNKKIEYQNYPKGKRTYKDELFRMVFSEKKDLLELYNAVNSTDYHNIDDLEINTLDNALYLSVKNDVSFLIDCTMNLYEHQSSYNPNMPLRGLFFITGQKINLINKYYVYRKRLKKRVDA